MTKPKAYLVYGEMGSGKNFVGELIAKHISAPFFDGDDLLPKLLSDKVKANKSLSLKEVDVFVYQHIASWLYQRDCFTSFVFAQALYRKKHRDYLKNLLEEKGFEVEMVFVEVSFSNHIKRLFSRKNGFRWAILGLVSKFWFEVPKPNSSDIVIDNNQNYNELTITIALML